MKGRGRLLLTVGTESIWADVAGVLGLGDHHLAAIVVKLTSGKNHQWTLNGGDTFDKEKDIFMVFL